MKTRFVLLGCLAATALAGCSNVATQSIAAERARLHHEPLSMSAEGHPDARIEVAGAVHIGSRALDLDPARRHVVKRYREAVIELTDFILAGTSEMTDHVMARSLFAMLTGRLDHMEKDIEQGVTALAHDPALCRLLDTTRQRQNTMVRAVAALKPYVHLSYADVENCFAGRPYKTNI